AAAEGEHHRVVGGLLGKIGVVIAPGVGAVAAADHEEVADVPPLDRIHHGARHAHHRVAGEAVGDVLLDLVLGEARLGKGGGNGGAKVPVADMGNAGPAHRAAGEQAVLVMVF